MVKKVEVPLDSWLFNELLENNHGLEQQLQTVMLFISFYL